MTAEGVVCIANISPRERQRRLGAGIVNLLIAGVVLAVLMTIGADRWWRLALFAPFFLAASGFFQWREKT
jgi:hypothetical protein